MRYYTGIGARNAPEHLCKLMTDFATFMGSQGWCLRTGEARGSDRAFSFGAMNGCYPMERYLVEYRKGVVGIDSTKLPAYPQAIGIAKSIHPNWAACSEFARKAHGQNPFQLLGHDLKTPSEFVVCYTERGLLKGGTATNIRLASAYQIPVINIGDVGAPQTLDDLINESSLLLKASKKN